MQLIDKDDFGAYVQFSDNLRAANVNFHCMDAQNFDFAELFPDATLSGNTFLADIETAFSESPVTRPELIAFFNNYVKAYLVCKAYARLLLWHGKNITQFGIRVNNEDTSNEITDKARSELIADINSKANVYLLKMSNAFKTANATFDSIVYGNTTGCDTSQNRKPKTRIVAI
jgi:hypothetical protein